MNGSPLKLHVTEAGQGGPTLVFLHYMGGSGRTWALVIDRLAAAYRCVAPDLRGWGNSPKDADTYDLEAMAADVAALITDLGLTEYVLVGHSMGGKISQMLAGRRPAGLVGLVLVASAPPTPLAVSAEFRQASLERYQSRDGMQEVLKIMAVRPLTPEVRERVISDTLGGAFAAKRAWLDQGMDLDISTAAAAIKVPTMVIVGTGDQVETEATLRREVGRLVPQTTFEILPSVGHLSPLEAPDEVADAIHRFLSGLKPDTISSTQPD